MSVGPIFAPIHADPPQSALEILRERTRGLHTQLEKAVDLAAALSSLPSYIRLLLGYLNIYTAFEAELLRQEKPLHEVLSCFYQSKVPSLERDLLALGADLPSREATSATLPLPALGDLDSVLGALYVVEGSSLGGQVIYRQIQDKLGLDVSSGAAFFFGNGDQTGVAWKRFTLFLNQSVSQPKRAADAAAAMFHAFESALQPSGNGGPSR